jgi:class 3 adenylate cyclase
MSGRVGDAPPPAFFADGPRTEGRLSLVARADGREERFTFAERLEIGRWSGGREAGPELLLIRDPTISWRHCVLRLRDGRVLVRDLSRNGTRIDGRRLVPNTEIEILPGQTLRLGDSRELVFEGDPSPPLTPHPARQGGTEVTLRATDVTVLVGDIRGYTDLVHRVEPERLQGSVSRVFAALERSVVSSGGTVKEYQGDAIFAFWEGRGDGLHARAACAAALTLEREARRLGADPAVWAVPGIPLRMEWGVASGRVVIHPLGDGLPTGLGMVGEAVPLAFRLEKMADEETGPILVCPETHRLACEASGFRFRDLGERLPAGFSDPVRIHALESLVLPTERGS